MMVSMDLPAPKFRMPYRSKKDPSKVVNGGEFQVVDPFDPRLTRPIDRVDFHLYLTTGYSHLAEFVLKKFDSFRMYPPQVTDDGDLMIQVDEDPYVFGPFAKIVRTHYSKVLKEGDVNFLFGRILTPFLGCWICKDGKSYLTTKLRWFKIYYQAKDEIPDNVAHLKEEIDELVIAYPELVAGASQ